MTVSIPRATGVPGISGPPDWLSTPPTGSYRLDDVRWNGATERTFGSGASQGAVFRATQAVVGAQQYIYLSFRAAFVQTLSDQYDLVYLGLQRHGTTDAMVIRIQVHGAAFSHSGPPPDSNPPANIAGVQISTRSGGATSWTVQGMSPTWINSNARAWVQSATDVPTDPNNRWAIQIRIPANNAGGITDNAGPNLGTDFDMWYLIQAGTSINAPVILADYRASGSTTAGDLILGNYPAPSNWDEFLLTTGPASDGGVAIRWGDVRVSNALYGEGTKIANGQNNTFIARPRNYRPGSIPAGDINATFRIANWGSVGGDPGVVDFATGVWDYVPGNSEMVPVISSADIPPLAAGTNPPVTNNQIQLNALMNLAAGKSLHQCIYVTLSGNNLTFLNNSIYQNMNFDHASLLERSAEISIRGLKQFSPRPRDVYLAVEKVNMQRDAPAGTNEGRFLESSMKRLMQMGGPLAEKLKRAQAILSDQGDFGSGARLETLLSDLEKALAGMEYSDREKGLAALRELIAVLQRWLLAAKNNPASAKPLADLFDALADWLLASGVEAVAKLAAFVAQLNKWLSQLNNDPVSSELLPGVVRALRAWLSTLANGQNFIGPIDTLVRWFEAGRPADQLPALINALRELLSAVSNANPNLKSAVAAFSQGTAAWLRGSERLETFVDVLSDVGLTTDELDQLFPTLRIHVYHDTGERVRGLDGQDHPVLRAQSSFGLYTYHEGSLEGWQTSLEGAQRIADNLYLIAVPNDGTAKVNVRVQAVEPDEQRIEEDPIVPIGQEEPCGCLCMILRMFGIGRKK